MSAFSALATIAYKSPGRVQWAETVRTDLDYLNRGVAQAYVLFDGTTATVTAFNSFNVSNITDSGAGKFLITFTTGFVNTSYMVAGSTRAQATEVGIVCIRNTSTARMTGSVEIGTHIANSTFTDLVDTSVIVFGTGA